jgi:hypothetical protein
VLNLIAVIAFAPYCWSCGISPVFRDRLRMHDPAASTDHGTRAVNVFATEYEFETEQRSFS